MTELACAASALASTLRANPKGGFNLVVDGDIKGLKVGDLAFPDPVTILGHWVGYNLFTGVENVTVGGEIVEPGREQKAADGSVKLVGSSALTFKGGRNNGVRNAKVSGVGTGLVLNGVDGLVVERVDFDGLRGALATNGCVNVRVANCNVRGATSDGFGFVATSNLVVEDNRLEAFAPAWADEVHPDAMQLRPNRVLMRGIVIRRNVIVCRDGVQGIFLGDGDVTPGEYLYEDVEISRNALLDTAWGGIALEGVKGAKVTENLVQGAQMSARIIARNSADLVVMGNQATAYVIDGASNTNVQAAANATIPRLAIGDTATLDAWTAKMLPAAPPSADAPRAADPRDAEIADLRAQVAALNGQLADAKAQIEADAKALAEMTAAREAASAEAAKLEATLDAVRAALAA